MDGGDGHIVPRRLMEEDGTLGECRPAGGPSVLLRVGAYAHVPLCQGEGNGWGGSIEMLQFFIHFHRIEPNIVSKYFLYYLNFGRHL